MESQFHSALSASQQQQVTSSAPIEIQQPNRDADSQFDSEMNLDETCMEQLNIGGRNTTISKKNNGKKNQSALSSSLPNIRSTRDVVDASGFCAKQSATPFRSPRPLPNVQSPVVDMYCEEYNMRHPRRGIAIILNHVTFETKDERFGSDKDCESLKRVLKNLGFEVQEHTDLPYCKLLSVLRDVSNEKEKHSLSDCLLVAVLTHGAKDELCAYDETYKYEKLWNNFTADRCPSLAGKPKIFIVQACRGKEVDPGTTLSMQLPNKNVDAVDASGGSTRFVIPNHADIIVANATVEGFYAWRNPTTGSCFIQTLCEQLEQHAESRDLLTILTFVSCRVAHHYESDVPNSDFDKMKQIPCVLSMLTRLVYLRRKHPTK